MSAPVLDHDLGFFEGVEDFAIEQLVSESTVEAFIIPIFPRAPRFNKGRVDLQSVQPVFEDLGGKFTAIVRPNISWCSLSDKQITEDIEYVIGFECPLDSDRQAFAGVFINHGQHPDGLSIGQPFSHKIIAPDMVGPVRPETNAGAIVQIQPSPFLLPFRDFQALFPPEAFHPFVIHVPPFGFEQSGDPFISVSPIP